MIVYNIIEYGTNKILASLPGAQFLSITNWCVANPGWLPHHRINARNWVVISV